MISYGPPDRRTWVPERTVFLTVAGSHAYGTSTEGSDHDLRGAVIPPRRYLYGLERYEQSDKPACVEWYDFSTHDFTDPDITVWNLRKFVRLAAQGNPNVIELLFTAPRHWIISTPYFRTFVDKRDWFLSKVLRYRFGGYALQQLKRIRNHKRWLDNPPDHQPTRAEFGIDFQSEKMPGDQLMAARSIIGSQVENWKVDETELPPELRIKLKSEIERMAWKTWEQLGIEMGYSHPIRDPEEGLRVSELLEKSAGRHLGFDSNFVEYLQKEKEYQRRLQDWHSYNGWLKNRNPARAELEKNFGYDTKHAMHLVRLLRMAREILEGKGVIVDRPDAEELKAIRIDGIWKYEDLIDWAEKEERSLDALMEKSPLPHKADTDRISVMLTEVTERFVRDKG
ncbi:DNA polymerase beta superfamily protein [Thermodesulfobacteriota bacterium]